MVCDPPLAIKDVPPILADTARLYASPKAGERMSVHLSLLELSLLAGRGYLKPELDVKFQTSGKLAG